VTFIYNEEREITSIDTRIIYKWSSSSPIFQLLGLTNIVLESDEQEKEYIEKADAVTKAYRELDFDSQKIIRKYAENVNKKLSSAPPKFYRLIWSDDEKKNFTMHIQNYLISPNFQKRMLFV